MTAPTFSTGNKPASITDDRPDCRPVPGQKSGCVEAQRSAEPGSRAAI